MIEIIAPPQRIGTQKVPMHIVLVEPEIPPNTGNVARLCAATGAWLHLVEPLGFLLDDKKVKRAGLDYWPAVRLSVHRSFEELAPRLHREDCHFFSKRAERLYTTAGLRPGCVLIFGKETTGLPSEVLNEYEDRCVRIPISSAVRSLNLSNAAAVAAYEVIRQNRLLEPT